MKFILIFIICSAPAIIRAQDYPEMMMNRSNLFETVKKFDEQWRGKTYERGRGWKQFKRWEAFWSPRLFPTGNFADPAIVYREAEKYFEKRPHAKNALGNWTNLGPFDTPQGGGNGRLNFISFHPASQNYIWVGAAAGGLWKSLNSGTGWSTSTDLFGALGMSDMVIDPTDNNIMYLATGDVDASDTYSTGVLKSTDAGQTWSTTGLDWTVQQNFVISKLAISPADHLVVYVAAQNGFYRSTDGAFSWQKLKTGNFRDIEIKPGDPNTLYLASQTGVFKSTNGGTTFATLNTGIDQSSVNRLTIAVTPANPDYLYILACGLDYGYLGLWLSENSGTSFTLKSDSPNLLTWSSSGNGSGGQGWYDLALAVSPSNAGTVFVGGVNVWKTTNKGSSWNCVAHWSGQGGLPLVHADIHDIKFSPFNSQTLYACTDGGLFRSTNNGTSWTDLSSGLAITQIYRIGIDPSDETKFLAGNQDNGTNRYFNGTWEQVLGGDGMDCITRGNTMYGSLYYGAFYKSTNGGNNFNQMNITSTEEGAWVSPIVVDPSATQTLFAGLNNIWKSTNSGSTWQKISDFAVSDGDKVDHITVAPSDHNYIYISKASAIYVTTNGGAGNVWNNITGTLPPLAITSITVDPLNVQRVWVTMSGYSAGSKVYYSSDSGNSWNNVSGSLPNIPVNSSVYQNNSSDAIYIGTDMGVFYINAELQDWIPYNGGMPNVIVNDLEIVYTSGKLRAATYGRGVWETPLFDFAAKPPLVDFVQDRTTGCKGSSVQFTDSTMFDPISWYWEFEGGNPSTSSLQNPTVVYYNTGAFDVRLTVTNANGQGETLKSDLINIHSSSAPMAEDFEQMQSSLSRFRLVTNEKSNVFVSTGDPVNVTHFLVLEGGSAYIDFATPDATTAFSINPSYFSSASLCVDAVTMPTVMLQFDYKLQYEASNNYTNFRVMVNGNQVAGVFQPSGATTQWMYAGIDLTAYAGTEFELSFEGNNRSTFNHILQNRGNSTLIDNINISEISDIGYVGLTEDFNISPNPAESGFYVSMQKEQDCNSFSVTNTLGQRQQLKISPDGSRLVIDCKDWPAGIYYFQAISNSRKVVRKVIKL